MKNRMIPAFILAVLMVFGFMMPASASEKEVELNVFWFADGAETDAMLGIIEAYEAITPGVKVNLLEVPFAEMSNKIMMAVSGGEPPAIARTTESILSVVNEATVDIADYMDKDELLAQFMPSIYNYFVLNGKVCAVPSDVTANGMIYNKTAFDKAGVSVPSSPDDVWTWDEFMVALELVMEKGDVRYGMVIDNPTHRWSTILYEFGGRYISPEGPAFNSAEAVEAVTFTRDLFANNIVPKSTWLGGEDPNNMFRSGQVAVHISGNWMLANYRDNITDFEWGVTYMPKKANRSSVPGGKQLAAFANTGVEQEAVDFILFATSQEQNAAYCEQSLFISPRLDNASLNYSFGSEFFEVFANELANTVPEASYDWGYPGLFAYIGTELRDGMYDVVSGKVEPADYVKAIDDMIQDFLDGK